MYDGIIHYVFTGPRVYTRDTNDIFMFGIDCMQATNYLPHLSRRVKDGIKTKIKNGWWPNLAPLGYLNFKKDKDDSIIIKDEKRWPLVRKLFDLMLSGKYTPPKICQIANGEWGFRTRPTKNSPGRKLSPSGIYKIFKQIFYTGQMLHNGVIHPANHPPMITPEEFDQVQALLRKRGTATKKQKHEFAFTGLISCGECGSAYTA